MKKYYLLLAASMMLSIMLAAQTQQGYVKTKGRMVNGKLVPGKGLKGATVSIKGKTAVVVNKDDGNFSFPIPETQFRVDSVRKKGYQMVDMDALSKTYRHSSNPIYLVMETPEQQLQDQLDAQRKIRRTLTDQLHQREDEIEALKKQQKITEEEYSQAIQNLYKNQEREEQHISEMAAKYAQMDYDQMDEINQRISNAILNGQLAEADSLIKSKGSIESRFDKIQQEQEAEANKQKKLEKEQADLHAAVKYTDRKIDNLAEDCYHLAECHRMAWRYDSVAYYLSLRLNLLKSKNDESPSARYAIAKTLLDLAQTIEIIKWGDMKDIYEPANEEPLAFLVSQVDPKYQEGLEILRELAKDNLEAYGPDLWKMLDLISLTYRERAFYQEHWDFSKHIMLAREALKVCRQLVLINPDVYEEDLLKALEGLIWAYFHGDGSVGTELCSSGECNAEPLILEEVETYKRMHKANPHKGYDLDCAHALIELAQYLSSDPENNTRCEAAYLEALEILENNRKTRNEEVAEALNKLLEFYEETHQSEKRKETEDKLIAKTLPATRFAHEDSRFHIGTVQYGTEPIYVDDYKVRGTKIWKDYPGNNIAFVGTNYYSTFSNNGKYFAKHDRFEKKNPYDIICTTIIYDVSTRKAISSIHTNPCNILVFSPDNKYLATNDSSPDVTVYDIHTGEMAYRLTEHDNTHLSLSRIVFSADGRLIVTASESDQKIIICDASSGERLKQYLIHPKVKDIAISPDNKYLISVARDGVMMKWDVETCATLWTLQNRDHDTGRVYSIAYSPTGNHFAVAYYNREIVEYEAETGAAVQTIKGNNEPRKIMYSPDGTLIIASDYSRIITLYGSYLFFHKQ